MGRSLTATDASLAVNTSGYERFGERIISGINFAITSNEVSNRLDMLVSGGPASATYRNLKFDYGYSMTFPKGWYLSGETERASRFNAYTGRRYANIITYESIAPFLDKSTELDLIANYLWDTALPQVAEEWVLFERISSGKVNIAGTEFYRAGISRPLGAGAMPLEVCRDNWHFQFLPR